MDPLFTIYRPTEERVEIPEGLRELIRWYGRPGHVKARHPDHGVGVREVRTYDFAQWMDGPPELQKEVRKFVRCPAWVLIEATGGSLSEPIGKWLFKSDKAYAVVSQLPFVRWLGVSDEQG